jgi:Asp-tRNA(Asn)/Glu-tRNA(Gln) amidotransferase A subunit family amidase
MAPAGWATPVSELAPPPAAPGPAESATLAALDRIQQLNLDLNAVIAVDPQAIIHARAVDAAGTKGSLAG